MNLEKETVYRYYNGTLFYQNLYVRKQDAIIFGEGVLSGSVKDVQTCSEHISEGANDSLGHQNEEHIVPAALNFVQYINDPRYLEWETFPKFVQEANSRTTNSELVQSVVSENSFYEKEGNTMAVKRRRNVESDGVCSLPMAPLTYLWLRPFDKSLKLDLFVGCATCTNVQSIQETSGTAAG